MVCKKVTTLSLVVLTIIVLLAAATSVSFSQTNAPDRTADASDVFLPLVVYQPLPPVRVLPNHSHYVAQVIGFEVSTVEVFGEVQNDSPDWVGFVDVPVSLLNDVGQVLATKEIHAKLYHLAPGQKTCFKVYFFSLPAGWSSYRVDAPTYILYDVELPKLTIYDDQGSYDPGSWEYTIEGKVRNDDSQQAKYVDVIATLYDASGTVFDCEEDHLVPSHLGPGESRDFRFNFHSRSSVAYEYPRDYADVASYRLQAEGEARIK